MKITYYRASRHLITGLLVVTCQIALAAGAPGKPRVMMDLPGNPLAGVEIGMSLPEFAKDHPQARAGLFGKPIDLKKQDQAVFEKRKFFGGSEAVAYHFRTGILTAVDYSIFLDKPTEYQAVLRKLVKHYRGNRGKEVKRHVIEEKGKTNFLAGWARWDGDSSVGIEFAPPESASKRIGLIVVRLAGGATGDTFAGFENRRKSVDDKKTEELFRDAE